MAVTARKFLALAIAVLVAGAAQAKYPDKSVRIVVPFAAGGVADITARIIAEKLGDRLGQRFYVENQPGAGGIAAARSVISSPPDGATLALLSNGTAVSVSLFKKLPFDPLKDFAPVTSVASLSFVLAVDAAGPIRSIDDLVKSLKAKPNHGFYGTGSNTGQVAAELFKEKMGLSTVYVPYKVTVDALTGVVGGSVDFISYDTTWAVTQHPQRIRILAVTAAKRQSALPDVPTLSELGLGEFDIAPWFGVVVPAGTPRPTIERLAGWFNQITNSADAKQFLARAALDAFPGSPEQMAAHLRTEAKRWERWVKLAKIEPQ